MYLYLTEVCPTDYRPLFFSICTLFVGLGMVFECIFAMYCHWQTTCASLFVLSTINWVSLFILPDSPPWLWTNGRVEQAEKAEKWLGIKRSPSITTIVTAENNAHNLNQLDDANSLKKLSYWTQFVQPTVWKPMLVTLTFFICQQCCGFYVLLFYSVDVLRDCRVQWDGIMVTMFLSISRIIGSVLFSALHHIRRKTMAAISSGGMAISLIAIVAYIKIYKEVADPPYPLFLIVAFVVYVFFAMLGMLPLPWSICSELFPIAIKGTLSVSSRKHVEFSSKEIYMNYEYFVWKTVHFNVRIRVHSNLDLNLYLYSMIIDVK